MKYFSCKSKSSVATSKSKSKNHVKKANAPAYQLSRSPEYRLFSYEELESATHGFSHENLLGKGSHGSVYKAIVNGGKLIAAVKKTTVAEENSNGSSSSSSSNHRVSSSCNPIENEIEILSRIRNKGLVNFLGYSIDASERKLIVVEFMANGALDEHLHCDRSPPGWGRRIRFALQIAKAVEALHLSDPPVIHRDIKSSNVLVDENWNARLGDFGLALRGHVEDVRIRSTPPAGTMGYLDPGYLMPENLSTKSDVFSFGILLLEMLSGRNAIDVNYSPPSVVDWAVPLIKQGRWDSLYDPRIGPPKDLFVRRQLAFLSAHCVRTGAERRPSMSEVVNCLRIVSRRVRSPIWGNLTNRIGNTSSRFEPNEELPMASKHSSRNSLTNRKVSNVQSTVALAKESTITTVGCSGCTITVGLVTETNAESDSIMGSPNSEGRKMGLVVGMPGIRLNKPRSIGIPKTSRVLHISAGKEPTP